MGLGVQGGWGAMGQWGYWGGTGQWGHWGVRPLASGEPLGQTPWGKWANGERWVKDAPGGRDWPRGGPLGEGQAKGGAGRAHMEGVGCPMAPGIARRAAKGPAPHLRRVGGTATVKAMLLEWCRARTRGYQVRMGGWLWGGHGRPWGAA